MTIVHDWLTPRLVFLKKHCLACTMLLKFYTYQFRTEPTITTSTWNNIYETKTFINHSAVKK